MKLKTFLAPVLVLLAFGLTACGGSGDSSTESGASSDTSSEPVTVQLGGKVIWQNEDTAPHTATADDGSFNTGTIEQGKIKSETFKQAGTFTYFCEIHPTMHGTVEVVDKD